MASKKIIQYYYGVSIKRLTDHLYPIHGGKMITKNTIKFKIHNDISELFFPRKEVKVRQGRVLVNSEIPCSLEELSNEQISHIINQIQHLAAVLFNIDVS